MLLQMAKFYSVLWLSNILSCIYTTLLFIISSVDRYLRFLPYLGNLNDVSINMKIEVHIFFQVFVFFFFFVCIPRSGIAGSYGSSG